MIFSKKKNVIKFARVFSKIILEQAEAVSEAPWIKKT